MLLYQLPINSFSVSERTHRAAAQLIRAGLDVVNACVVRSSIPFVVIVMQRGLSTSCRRLLRCYLRVVPVVGCRLVVLIVEGGVLLDGGNGWVLGSHQRWSHIAAHRQRRVEQLLLRRRTNGADAAGLRIDGDLLGFHHFSRLEYAIFEQIGPIDPPSGILDEHAPDERFDDIRHLEGYFQFLGLQNLNELGDGTLIEGALAIDHFKQYDPQRPDIGLHGVDLPGDDFRCHVDGRSQHGLSQIGRAFQTLTEPEVSNLNDTVVQQNIVWF